MIRHCILSLFIAAGAGWRYIRKKTSVERSSLFETRTPTSKRCSMIKTISFPCHSKWRDAVSGLCTVAWTLTTTIISWSQGTTQLLTPGQDLGEASLPSALLEFYRLRDPRLLSCSGGLAMWGVWWPSIYNSKRDLSMYFRGYFGSYIITGGKWKLYTDTNFEGHKESYSGKQMMEYLESDSLFLDHKVKSIKRKK